MNIAFRQLLPLMWIAWALYWGVKAFDVKLAAKREPFVSRLLHMGPLALATALLWVPRLPYDGLDARFLPPTAGAFWAGCALTAAGLLLTVWARRYLGRNWSAIVAIKEGHEFVASGPYAYVRHPIYTGLLLGFAGTALALGEWRGLLAVAILAWAFWRKLRLEERFMSEQFGEAYRAYCRRVAALLPFLL